MIDAAVARRLPVELSPDRRFERRVKRLTAVSAIALGLIWALSVATLEVPTTVGAALAAGWVLMPATLLVSLRYPKLRYGLVVPASLVSVGLLAICLGWLPDDPIAAIGWVLMLVGIAVGGGLGLWFWYRLLPVPARFDDPFSKGRWALIGAHVLLVVGGFVLAAQALLG